MPTLEVRERAVGPWPMNTYVLICPATNESMLVDPGAAPDTLQEMLADTTPKAILLTHTHRDHIGALDEMRQLLQVPVFAPPGPHVDDVDIDADRTLTTGDTIALGEHTLEVYHTPGHTEDMICFRVVDEPTIIVGDTIFAGGPGKTWSHEGFTATLRTLRDVVLTWPDDAMCYPGHGPSFRLGDKRSAIETFLAKDHGADFFGDADW